MWGFGTASLYLFRGTPATTVFSDISVRRCKNCLEFSIAWGRLKIFTWQFHSCTIFEAYLIKSLCDSPKTVFWWFHLFFRSGFVCSVLFSRLNSQWAKKKMYSSKGIISLWSALSSFFFLRYKLNLVGRALQFSHDSFGRNWIRPYSALRFRKTGGGGRNNIFLQLESSLWLSSQLILNYFVFQSSCCWELDGGK